MGSTTQGDALFRHGHLISLLIQHGPTTRSQLVELTGATQPTITRWVADLINAGLVRDLGIADGRSGPGRPSLLIDLVGEAVYVGAFHIRRPGVEVGVVNAKGQVVVSDTLTATEAEMAEPALIVDRAAQRLKAMLATYSIDEQRLLGIGAAVSGLADTGRGVEERISFGDQGLVGMDVPVRERLTSYFNIPVLVETNAWAMAVGERWFGYKETNFILLYVEEGVGAAVVVNGHLHRGRGAAGEIEHVPVPGVVASCYCGQVGCLGTVVARKAVMENASALGYSSISELVRAADTNSGVVQVLQECARAIGYACVPLVDLLDPEALVLAGPLFAAQTVSSYVERYLKQQSFTGRLHGIKVMPTSLGEQVGLVGAASLVYGRAFGNEGSLQPIIYQ